MAGTEAAGRGFGPGLPATGGEIVLRRVGPRLRIEGWPGVDAVAEAELTTTRRGRDLLLEWRRDGEACALLLTPEAAAKVSLGGTAAGAAARQDRATRAWLWASLFVLVGLPLLLAALVFGFRHALIDAATARIPVAQEQQLAEQVWAMQKARLALIEGTAANRAVEALGARLVAVRPTAYTYRFHVADDRTVNAFALPAGYIVVHRGLIEKAASAEELAGVLAHEIEHVEGRHALRGMVQALGFHAVWLALTGDLGGGLAGEGARQLAGLHFSREQETAADRGAFERMVAAGIDPRGLASFFETLAREQAAMPEMLSSHPASESRSAALKALLAGQPPLPPLDYDWASVRGSVGVNSR